MKMNILTSMLAAAGFTALLLPTLANAGTLPAMAAPVSVDAVADLGDAQQKLQLVLNGIRHDDRCGPNWNVWDARVIPNGSAIKVDLHARYFVNRCIKTKRPVSLVRWKNKVVFETKLFSQAGHIVIDFTPVAAKGVITLHTKVVTADMSGLLGRLKVNGQIKDLLEQKIQDVVRDKVTAALPPELKKAGFEVHEISFPDLGGGKLGVRIKASGKLQTNS